jgi:F-type H+-transporting ATPase subunit delta
MSEPMDKLIEPITTDVGAQRIARVYAEALYDVAQTKGEAQDALDELNALIGEVFRKDAGLEVYLSSGAVGRHHKKDLIDRTFIGRSSETFSNFLLVLNHHDRLDLLRPIQREYKELFEERTGLILVEVRSARALSEQQVEKLRNELRESFKREPVLAMKEDADLIGGLMVKVGDWLFDASVRTELETLRNQLIESSSHAIQSGRDRFSSPA